MSKLMLGGISVLLLGIVLGVVSGRWDTVGDAMPRLRDVANVSQAPADRTTVAKAVVENGEIFDFGTMEQNATMSHTFIIRNDGGLPLELTKGSTSCKCTLSNLNDSLVAPGKSAEIKLEWSAKTSEPVFSQSAEIHTNDLHRPTIRLVVRGNVRQAIKTERGELLFNQVTADDTATAKMKIFGFLSENLTLVKQEYAFPERAANFEVQTSPLSSEDLAAEPGALAGLELAVTLKPGLPLGTIQQTLRLTLKTENETNIEIPFHGKIVSDISLAGPKTVADQNTISLGSFERGETSQITCFLLIKGSQRDTIDVKLVDFEPADRLKATLGAPIRDNPKLVRIPLTVEIIKDAPPGNFFGTSEDPTQKTGLITLATTHPHVPELKIKVRFLIKD